MWTFLRRVYSALFHIPDVGIPYKKIVESTNDGIWLLDRQGRTTFVNSQMSVFLGYEPADLMGKRPSEFMDAEMARMVEERLKIRESGRAETYEARYRRKDGSELWVSTTGSPIRSRRGEFRGSLGVHKNITEKKHLEQQMALQQAKVQTASKLSALGEMAGGIAHEINNPLTTILMLSSKLQKLIDEGKPVDQDFLRQSASRIADTSRRIAKIVDGLRMFSRDGTKDPFRPERVSAIIEETLSLCNERFTINSIELSVSGLESQARIDCKAMQVSQALLNLLNNAFHAALRAPEKWVKVELLERPEQIEIRVTDSGSGISGEVRARMFEPFYTTKEVGQGTGLGLSIALGLIEAHHGTLSLEESSRNTCFVIVMPRKQAPPR